MGGLERRVCVGAWNGGNWEKEARNMRNGTRREVSVEAVEGTGTGNE